MPILEWHLFKLRVQCLKLVVVKKIISLYQNIPIFYNLFKGSPHYACPEVIRASFVNSKINGLKSLNKIKIQNLMTY